MRVANSLKLVILKTTGHIMLVILQNLWSELTQTLSNPQVNVTAVWLSLRPNWRSEASRAEWMIFTQVFLAAHLKQSRHI